MPRILLWFLTILLLGALAVGSALWLSGDPNYTAQAWLAGGRYRRHDLLIVEAARRQGLDPRLLKAIVWRESRFSPEKIGSSGERGLMQVGEAAARDWAKAEKIDSFQPTDLFDPKINLEVGSWYFRKALDRWKQKRDPVPFALATYNAGAGRVERWIAASQRAEGATAEDLLRAIDFPTTRKYIEDITARQRFYAKRGEP